MDTVKQGSQVLIAAIRMDGQTKTYDTQITQNDNTRTLVCVKMDRQGSRQQLVVCIVETNRLGNGRF